MTNERIDDRVRFGWLCSYTPLEILAAAGLTPVRMDAGSEESYTADRMGYAVDTCSAHRAALGAEELGLYPHADLLISTTHFCDGKPKCNEIFKEKYEMPFHLIDPLENDESAVDYVEGQLGKVFVALCDLTGKKENESVLVEAIRNFNCVLDLMIKVKNLR